MVRHREGELRRHRFYRPLPCREYASRLKPFSKIRLIYALARRDVSALYTYLTYTIQSIAGYFDPNGK